MTQDPTTETSNPFLQAGSEQTGGAIEALTQHVADLEEQLRQTQSALQTERTYSYQIKNTLERAKKEWEAAVDTVSDLILLTDSAGKILRCNQPASRYLQLAYTDIIGHSVETMLFGNQAAYQEAIQAPSHEIQIPRLGGGWFSISIYPLVLTGSFYGQVFVLQDITGRREARERLEASQRQLRQMNDELEQRIRVRTQELSRSNQELQHEMSEREKVQAILAKEKEMLAVTLLSIGDAVISTDTQGIINTFNSAAEKMTGLSQENVLGKPFNQVLSILDRDTNRSDANALGSLLSTNPLDHFILVDASGAHRLISSSSAPVRSEAGEELGYVMVINDITEQKRIEEQLALSQKMESIGRLASGIAHEINTPMQYVGDNTHFMQEAFQAIVEIFTAHANAMEAIRAGQASPEMLQKLHQKKEDLGLDFYISEVPVAIRESLEGIDRVRKIVHAMKAFAHPSNDEKTLSNINQGIETTVTISRNEWKYVADLETDLSPNLPLVFCRIDEINQVILNMIVNARDAIQEKHPENSQEKGKILIRTQAEDGFAVISISDSGNGMPAEIVQRIFDPFFTTKEVGKGTGQGLSLAHNIVVTHHHGQIKVNSDPGKGTTFQIWLPIHDTEQAMTDDEDNA